MKKLHIPVIIISFGLIILMIPCSGYNLSFTYTNMDGQIISFSVYEGKYLFVEAFWTECSHCIAQHPILKQVDDHYLNEINMLSISIHPDDTIPVIQAFIDDQESKGHPTTWDIGRDHTGSFGANKGVTGQGGSGTPTMFLFDENGVELKKWVGETSYSELTSTIDYYLYYTGPSGSTTPSYDYTDDGHNGSVIGDLFGSPIFQVGFFSLIIFMLYFKVAGGKST